MAAYTLNFPPTSGGQTVSEFPEGVRVVKWVLTSADPNGTWYICGPRTDKTVHVFGTIATAAVAIQGSNESDLSAPVNPATLHTTGTRTLLNTAGALAALPDIEEIAEDPWFIAPSLTTPGAGATITVELMVLTVPRR